MEFACFHTCPSDVSGILDFNFSETCGREISKKNIEGLLGATWTKNRAVDVKKGVEHFINPDIMEIHFFNFRQVRKNLLVRTNKNIPISPTKVD